MPDVTSDERARPVMLHVGLSPGRAVWQVVVPDQCEPITCATLADATHTASSWAARYEHDCELLVHDAYHRVVHREIIRNRHDPPRT